MQIDLEQKSYRRAKPTKERNRDREQRTFMRATTMAALWCAAVVIFGRYADHNQPWFVILSAGIAPFLMVFYIAISLDD